MPGLPTSKEAIKKYIEAQKMSRNYTSTFVLELPIAVRSKRKLLVALDCLRQLKNAVLGECLKRLDLLRQSREFQAIRKFPKTAEKERKTRNKKFSELNKKFKFTSFDIQNYALGVRNNCHIGQHVLSHEAQSAARDTFRSVFEYALGKRGRPGFLRKDEQHTLEAKTNNCCIRYKNDKVYRNGEIYRCIIDPEDKVIQHGLSCPVKYCRLVRKAIGGKDRFYVQLILEGKPYQKYEYKNQRQGLDLAHQLLPGFQIPVPN